MVKGKSIHFSNKFNNHRLDLFFSKTESSKNAFEDAMNDLSQKTNDSIIFYIHDFCTSKNVYVSNNFEKILGHPASKSINEPFYIFEMILAEDLKRMVAETKNIFESLLCQPPEDVIGTELRFQYRIRKLSGEIITVLDQITLTKFDYEGKLSMGVGYMLDITNLCLNSTHTVWEVRMSSGKTLALPNTRNTNKLFSIREIEILKMIEGGMQSKEIADKLQISVNTVHNHRQKMMLRFDAHNIMEVLKIAKDHQII